MIYLIVFWIAIIAQTATIFGWKADPLMVQTAAFLALMSAAHARSKQIEGKDGQ